MSTTTAIEKGSLIIADISGYTAFLAQMELAHSREIMDSLLGTLVEHFEPPLIVARLEGDAVFSYVPESSMFQAQTMLEILENIYDAFCRSRDNINRSCTCQACVQTGSLDLKFVVHHGEYSHQTIGGIRELQGMALIIVHRLLKNHIKEATGINTYAFFSEAVVKALTLENLTQGMIAHSESYEHLGEVKGFVMDMRAAWERSRERRRVYIGPEEAWAQAEFELPGPPAVAWEFLNHPQCMCEWCGWEEVKLTDLQWGRVGVGSGRYCVHAGGKDVTVDTILDYQPFDYVTVETKQPNQLVITTTTELRPIGDKTRVLWRVAKPGGPRLKALARQSFMAAMKGQIVKDIQGMGAKLREMMEAEMTSQA